MRPRIYQAEAKFLLEMLEKEQATYEKIEAELNEKLKPLKITVSKAVWHAHNYMRIIAEKEYNYPACVNELTKLQNEYNSTLNKLSIYKNLVNKYRRIAEEKKGCGRYRMDEVLIKDNWGN